jgi:hypothetical protein
LKRVLSALAAVSIGLVLAACASGPQRDDSGRVTESATISARDLMPGDCFSFNSPDGSTVGEVTVLPCSDDHDNIVLDEGVLSRGDISDAGSLQNAVNAACETAFTDFKIASTFETRPEQTFMVFPLDDKDADGDQVYTCVSTDPGRVES